MIRWLVRVALLFVVALIFFRWLGRALGLGSKRPREPQELRGGTMERDPVCGTFVARELSFPEPAGDHTLYFCSERCRLEYRAGRRLEV